MLTLEETLDEDQYVSTLDAMHEIVRHGHSLADIVIENGETESWLVFTAEPRERIAKVYGGEVRTADVMRWLGY